MVNVKKRGALRGIVPFWTRMPSFFLYPFHLSILLRVLIFSAVAVVGMLAGSIGAIIFALTMLLSWILMLRFASRVLVETSLGRLSPGDWGLEPPPHLTYMPFKIFFMLAIYGLFVVAVMIFLGEVGAVLANLGMTLLMPAAMIALVIGGRFFGSLNPAVITDIIRSIGKPYLLLCLFLFCLSSSSMVLSTKLGEMAAKPLFEQKERIEQLLAENEGKMTEEMAEELAQIQEENNKRVPRMVFLLFLTQVVSMHFLVISFNMMGYVAYQYHGELGLKADNEGEAEEEEQPQVIARLLAHGEIDEALEVAYEAQRTDPFNPNAMEAYNKLLHLADKGDRLVNHTAKLIPLLMEKGLPDRAFEALRRCREKQADFTPAPADLVSLAKIARQRRDPKLALQLLNGFERKFSNNPLIPDVYFLCGSILCEDLRQDSLAIRFFNALHSRYPQHERAADAQRLVTMLQGMQKA